jgi:hypothetical protein
MANLITALSPNSTRVERLLGPLAQMHAEKTKGWYGPAIPILGTPLRIGGDGEFQGLLRGGQFASLADYTWERYKAFERRFTKSQRHRLNTGFASLSDLISEATAGGKRQQLLYQKTGVAAAAVGNSQSLWGVGALPTAGSNAAAAPGGTQFTRATAGALGQANPGGADTLHLTTWTGQASVAGSVMLFDQVWGANINHATTANAISGTLARYNAADAAGNFLSGRVTTVLGATAHNLTATYVDNAGNAAEAAAALAVRVSSAVNTMPLTAPAWFVPLNSGDTGLRNVTSLALSAASTGNVDWFIGRPLGILPQPVANIPFILDGINSAFNLVEVKTDACLCLMEYTKSAVTATAYGGLIQLVSG